MLTAKRDAIRQRLIKMYKKANAGHVGSSLSSLEIITFIKFELMEENDELILSKGHAAALLYSVLAEEGIISEEEIDTFYQNGTHLSAHPPVNKIKKIPFATGSLGHGLSIAAGFAIAGRLKGTSKKIYCISSDGELNEGSTWEALLFIGHHNLKNIVWFIDRNNLQGFGRTEEILKLEPLDKKIRDFGFQVAVADGHSFESLRDCISRYKAEKPLAIICNTLKGRGLSTEDTVDCHYLPLTENDYLKMTNQ